MKILYQQRRSVYVDSDWSLPGYEHDTNVAMFDSPEALTRQIREVVQMPSRYDVEEWNRCGDEILVEPGTAEGCMWYGLFHKGPMHEVMKAYTLEDSLYEACSSFYDEDDEHADNAFDILSKIVEPTSDFFHPRYAFGGKRMPYIEYSVADETIMRAAQALLPAMKWYWDTHMLEVMSEKLLRRNIQFDIDHGRDDSTRHMFSIIYDNDVWNAMIEGRQINETVLDRLNRESLEYYLSEEGQAEEKVEQERHDELMTYMGESGLNSYSVDADGRYTMWRD